VKDLVWRQSSDVDCLLLVKVAVLLETEEVVNERWRSSSAARQQNSSIRKVGAYAPSFPPPITPFPCHIFPVTCSLFERLYPFLCLCMPIIILITRFSCLEVRCVCRQAAVKAAKILPLVRTRRIQARPNQSWARCSVIILPSCMPMATPNAYSI
jgi:hypothetical protein